MDVRVTVLHTDPISSAKHPPNSWSMPTHASLLKLYPDSRCSEQEWEGALSSQIQSRFSLETKAERWGLNKYPVVCVPFTNEARGKNKAKPRAQALWSEAARLRLRPEREASTVGRGARGTEDCGCPDPQHVLSTSSAYPRHTHGISSAHPQHVLSTPSAHPSKQESMVLEGRSQVLTSWIKGGLGCIACLNTQLITALPQISHALQRASTHNAG